MYTPFKLRKILIPVDFSISSSIALEHAAELCKHFNIELHLLNVCRSINADVLPSISASNIYVHHNEAELKSLITEKLNELGHKLNEKYNVSYQIEVRNGNVAKEITKSADENEIDLIVMGTHGVKGFEEFFIGSNAYRVVTSAKQPVLTVQSSAKNGGYQSILLPIDSTIHTRDKVSQAALIAKAFDAKIHIVGLITEEHEEEEAIYKLKIKQIEEYLEGKGVKYNRTLMHGEDIADMTLNFAKENNVDLIVMMTEQEASTGLFVGPYAQRIVNHSKTPVLSVTPIQIIDSFSRGELGGDYRPFHI
tara:strand:+ start:1938 stop:2858 length:921 start_codon:yes stop_codon:yes gene_type:complete